MAGALSLNAIGNEIVLIMTNIEKADKESLIK